MRAIALRIKMRSLVCFLNRRISLDIETIEVRSLVETVTNTLKIYASQKNLELNINCDRAPQQIQTDPLKLQQIVTNLIGNAIRYTESGTITITC